jgi:intracellular multiplication protein IcmW
VPSLSNEEIHGFWYNHQDKSLYKIISFMESVENWTYDDDQSIDSALEVFGTGLDDIGYVDLQEEKKIITVISSLKIGRALRILQCLDTAHPGAAAKLLSFAKKNSTAEGDIYDLFIKRNIVFERLRLLGRIFSKDRLTTVLQTIGDMEHD